MTEQIFNQAPIKSEQLKEMLKKMVQVMNPEGMNALQLSRFNQVVASYGVLFPQDAHTLAQMFEFSHIERETKKKGGSVRFALEAFSGPEAAEAGCKDCPDKVIKELLEATKQEAQDNSPQKPTEATGGQEDDFPDLPSELFEEAKQEDPVTFLGVKNVDQAREYWTQNGTLEEKDAKRNVMAHFKTHQWATELTFRHGLDRWLEEFLDHQ